jgi:hypothetical protein
MKGLNMRAEDDLRRALDECESEVLRKIFLAQAIVAHTDALGLLYLQVRNGARWDFKDEIGRQLGPGITLCASSGCHEDVEYSVLGNVFFGYIGRASGFPWFEIKAGAALAERYDPAHDPNS